MKHLLFTLLLSLLGCLGAKAQQTLSFVYDASGNRVARVIIMSSIIATGEEPSEEDEAVQAEENLLCQSAKMTLLERGYSSWQYFCTNGDHCTNPAHQYRTSFLVFLSI